MDVTEDRPRTDDGQDSASPAPVPGLAMVLAANRPVLQAIELSEGRCEIGRGEVGGITLVDAALSRRHARVSFDKGRWRVADLGSRNGTWVDGKPAQDEPCEHPLVLRVGGSLFLFCDDVRLLRGEAVEQRGERVLGPKVRRALAGVERAARSGAALHISGESGTGKELAARAFHAAGPHPRGPFVPLNCATIPEGVAERILFGAVKGAYSGAHADSEGLLQEASGGTLFLDEVGDLDAAVQAKLLRALETREILPVGARRPRQIDVRVCSATHKGLRAQVAAGRFREDLYFRIGRPEVELPPLRERREEIPHLIARALDAARPGLVARVSLVEACLLRPWPGNVRELLAEIRAAAQAAMEAGQAEVEVKHLSPAAGTALLGEKERAAPSEPALEPTPRPARRSPPAAMPSDEVIEETLRRERGNVLRSADALKLHRNQLRRWIEKRGINPRSFALPPDNES